MLLSKLVGAILNDLTTAQDFANEYSSQLSRKYKKFEDEKENILSNFQVPAGILQEIELDLKFAVESLEDCSALDIEETRENCEEIARKAAKSAVQKLTKFIDDLGIPARRTETATTQAGEIPPLISQQQPETSTSSVENQQAEVIKFWQSTKKNLSDPKFAKFLQTIISQELFDRGKGLYLRAARVTEADVKTIIEDKLEDGIIGHHDIQELLNQTQEIFDRDPEEIRDHLRSLFTQVADDVVNRKDIRELITLMPGVCNTNIVVNSSALKEIPIDMVSSLKIKAHLDNYRWMITETSQSLQKVKE